jgi:hypothetical protein
LTNFCSKNLNWATKKLSNKLAEHLKESNFCKRRPRFWATD